MKTFKSGISLFLAFMIMISIFSVGDISVNAASYETGKVYTTGKIKWKVSKSGELTIKSNTESNEKTPNYSTDKYAPWHSLSSKIKTVVIGNSITYIGNYALYGLNNATKITIGSKVDSLGTAPFGHTDKLTKFAVASGNKNYITTSSVLYTKTGSTLVAYPSNKSGTEFTVPDSVTAIKGYAFHYNQNLTKITHNTPGNIKTVNSHAFANAKKLKTVVLKNNVTTLGNKVFYGASSISNVTIPPSVTSLGTNLFSTDAVVNIHCTAGSKIYDYVKNKSNLHIVNQTWTFTCYFDAGEGECENTQTSVTFNSKYGTLPKPELEGYSFDGWYLNDKQITASTTVTTAASHTLKAKYTGKTYTIELDPMEGDCNTSSVSVTMGKPFGELPIPEYKGHTFLGWYTDYGDRIYTDTVFDNVNIDCLYAMYADTYTVELNANGGICDTQTIELELNTKFGTLPTPVKTGYTFLGWFTEDGTHIYTDTIFDDERIDCLYARYIKNMSKVSGVKLKYISKKKVTLTWSKQSGISGYKIYKKTGNDKYKLYKTTSSTKVNIKLSAKKSYKFKVRAYINEGDNTLFSEYSSSVSRPKCYIKKPSLKKNYNKSSGILSVKWKDIKNAKKYIVYKKNNGKWKKVLTTNSSAFNINTNKNKKYTFKVRTYTTVLKHKIYSKFSYITQKT